jgi:hypothetical protein
VHPSYGGVAEILPIFPHIKNGGHTRKRQRAAAIQAGGAEMFSERRTECAGALLIFLKLVLNIFLKFSKEGFDPSHLSIHLSERGLWRVADPHLLRKQPFQLCLLPLEGVEDIDCCLWQALAPAALLVQFARPTISPIQSGRECVRGMGAAK